MIPPESLSLSYISNSTILRFVEKLGVNLDIFYRLLWRHIFAVELTKRHFNIRSEEDKRNFWQRIWQRFTDQKNRKALQYLEDWGKSFWEETEYRIQEVTTKLEDSLKGRIGATLPKGVVAGNVERIASMSEEQKGKIVERAQSVVNEVQIRQLSDIMELLDQILDDPQKQYYVLIDRLDEDWIEDALRYRLIRALIETVRDFRKVRNAKIVVAIREDLLERVFRIIRGSGFQEEKYESMYLRLNWSGSQLLEIMEKRLNHLLRDRYTRQKLTMTDVLPKSVEKQRSTQYILDRTLQQPRDVIHFLNKCIQQVVNKRGITAEALKKAEGEYSRDRLRYLADEWHSDYPNLIEVTKVLRKQPARFAINKLDKACEEFCLEFACANLGANGLHCRSYLAQCAIQTANAAMDVEVFRNHLIYVLHRVGVIGVKVESHESYIWSFGNKRAVSTSEICDGTQVQIHPAFWRVLGTVTRPG
ncbi:MAG: hypothetical protein JW993_17905 [Sedimentisphaerales bacterium]|nr:hypothetical protein [Sedimentisphaerales bacterium]